MSLNINNQKDYTNEFQQHNHSQRLTISSLNSCLSTKYVHSMITKCGKGVIYHKWSPYSLGFNFDYDLYLQNKWLSIKSPKYQTQIDNYLQDLLFFYCENRVPTSHKPPHISLYTILVKYHDARPTGTKYHGGIDKSTGKSVYSELHHVVSLINHYLSKQGKHGLIKLVNDSEIPSKISKSNHLYLHPHNHFMFASTNDKCIYGFQRYLNKLQVKYNLVSCHIQPLYWSDYCINHNGSHNIPVSLSLKPKMIPISVFKIGSRIIKPFTNKPKVINWCGVPCYDLNSNQVAIFAVNHFINYLMTDYRIQTKDTDPTILNDSHNNLTHSQRHLIYMSWMSILKGQSAINKVSTQTIKATHHKVMLHKGVSNYNHMTSDKLLANLKCLQLTKQDHDSKVRLQVITANLRLINKINHKVINQLSYADFKRNKTIINANQSKNNTDNNKLSANSSLFGNQVYSVAINDNQLIVNTYNLHSPSVEQLQIHRLHPT